MAIDEDSYGTVLKVEDLIGDMGQGRKFNYTDTPTIAQVEDFINDMAAELNMWLENYGYASPVIEADFPNAHRILYLANSAGAAAMVLSMQPAEAFVGLDTPEAQVTNRKTFLWAQFRRAKSMIEDRSFVAPRNNLKRYSRVISGSNKQGNTRPDFFRRHMLENPRVGYDTQSDSIADYPNYQ